MTKVFCWCSLLPGMTCANICFNLSTSIFSYLLVFVAIKLQDCASCSICSRLITRLVNLSILLSWILIISRRSSTFGLDDNILWIWNSLYIARRHLTELSICDISYGNIPIPILINFLFIFSFFFFLLLLLTEMFLCHIIAFLHLFLILYKKIYFILKHA